MFKEIDKMIRENVNPVMRKVYVHVAILACIGFVVGSTVAVIWSAAKEPPPTHQQLAGFSNDPAARPQIATQAPPPPANSEIAASVDVQGHTCTPDGPSYLLKVNLHITSKFTRSGVSFYFRANEIENMESLEAGHFMAGNLLEKSPGLYTIYFSRPWGIYVPTLKIRGKQTVRFTYRFEGETESTPKEIVCGS